MNDRGSRSRHLNRDSPDRTERYGDHRHGGRRKLSEELDRANKFSVKNGCCRDCMKAFSKSGKVSHVVKLGMSLSSTSDGS